MKKQVAVVLTVLFASGLLSGCNTIEGAGKGIERGGEKVQGAAKDVKQNISNFYVRKLKGVPHELGSTGGRVETTERQSERKVG